MRGSEHTSVEEQVMSSARTYLYGGLGFTHASDRLVDLKARGGQ